MYVVINLDRLLKICLPQYLIFLHRKRIQVAISTFVYAAWFLINSIEIIKPYYWQYDSNETMLNTSIMLDQQLSNTTNNVTMGKCVYNDPDNIFNWFYFAIESIVPFAIMLTSSMLVVSILFNTRQILENQGESSYDSANVHVCVRRDRLFAVVLVALDVSFLLLNTPLIILYPLSYVVTFDWHIFYVITSILFYTRFALVFYINLVFNSLFRKELMRLVDFVFIKIEINSMSRVNQLSHSHIPMSIHSVEPNARI